MHETKSLVLLAAAQRTATATGSAINTAKSLGLTIPGSPGFARHLMVALVVTAGAAGTLDLTIEGSWDGGTTWLTLTPSSAWSQVGAATSSQVRRYEGPIPPYIRAKGTGASSPDHTYSVRAVAGG